MRRLLLLLFVSTLSCSAPRYPHCRSNDDCAAKGEVCANGQCQECIDDGQCAHKYQGEVRSCQSGRCEPKLQCQSNADCAALGADLACRQNRCVPECTKDSDCQNGTCKSNKCFATCQNDVECGGGRACVAGSCQAAQTTEATQITDACRPKRAGDTVATETVHFEFDQYELTAQARATLDRNFECLKQAKNLVLVLEGHCDERGTQEYNLALGERRASTVRTYLKYLGIDPDHMQTRSKGENEPLCRNNTEACHATNRRVELLQQSSTR